MIEFGSFRILKGKTATQHGIQDNATTPNINHNSLIPIFALNHFRGSITRRSTSSLKFLILSISIRKSKFNNPNGLVIVDKQILRFQISMNNVKFMNIFDASDDLLEDFTSLTFGNPALDKSILFAFYDVIE